MIHVVSSPETTRSRGSRARGFSKERESDPKYARPGKRNAERGFAKGSKEDAIEGSTHLLLSASSDDGHAEPAPRRLRARSLLREPSVAQHADHGVASDGGESSPGRVFPQPSDAITSSRAGMSALMRSLPSGRAAPRPASSGRRCRTSRGNSGRPRATPELRRMRKCRRADSNTSARGRIAAPGAVVPGEAPARARSSRRALAVRPRTATSRRARTAAHRQAPRSRPRRGGAGRRTRGRAAAAAAARTVEERTRRSRRGRARTRSARGGEPRGREGAQPRGRARARPRASSMSYRTRARCEERRHGKLRRPSTSSAGAADDRR